MTGVRTRTAAAVTIAMTMLALAGCGTASADPVAAPSKGTAPSSAPTQNEPAAPKTDPADPATWTVTAQGIGPIELGGSFADAQATLPSWTGDEQCTWVDSWTSTDHSQTGLFARDHDDSDGDVNMVAFESLEDTVAPADGPRTEKGIGLGSTRDEVMAAYPDAASQKPVIADGELLRVGAQGSPAIYFAIREGASMVSAVTVTAMDEPQYEVCG
ncbi:hypothetical protein [Microbacterium sp.]|uniref:hypothetical protein n=1 Tax=Microbacterium sp. TaxID=51671 RepID=UPI003A9254F3